MKAYVYRGLKSPGQLLVLSKENGFSSVPKDVLDDLGPLNLYRTIDIEPGQQRIAIDPDRAISDLEDQGYHLEDLAIRLNLISSDRVAAA